MKKKFMLFISMSIFIVLLSVEIAIAQSWLITGNNNTTALSKLGTTNFIPLGINTNNKERIRIDETGRVGIGTTAPVNILTIKTNGGTPVSSWLNGLTSPVIAGFSETYSNEFLLATASSGNAAHRSVFQGRRSRGTLAAPLAVVNNDYITSLLASAYDGSNFQNPALVSFFVDGVPSSGNVPTRISFVTGSNATNRMERLKVGSNGDFNFNSGQLFIRQSDGNVGIGTTSPVAKLQVNGSSSFKDVGVNGFLNVDGGIYSSAIDGTGISGVSTFGRGTNAIGVSGQANAGIASGVIGSASGEIAEGVYGDASGDENGYLIHGIHGKATSTETQAQELYGVYGEAIGAGGAGVFGTAEKYGIYGLSSGSEGIGVYGNGHVGVSGESDTEAGSGLTGIGNGDAYGVYGTSYNSYGIFGATGTGSSYAGYFVGDVFSSGDYIGSDRTLKSDITDVSDGIDLIKKLQPKSYNFRHDGNYKLMNLPTGKHYGLIAQDVEQVLPNLVKATTFKTDITATSIKYAQETKQTKTANSSPAEIIKFKALNYTELIPFIIKGMQEQQTQIEKLTSVNEDLQNQINELKSLILQGNNGSSTNSVSGYLKQNIPNPTGGNTVISYYLPADLTQAQIRITDIKGSVLKVYNASAGASQVSIRSGELPAGVYNYTLFVNNKKLDTKQMVIIK